MILPAQFQWQYDGPTPESFDVKVFQGGVEVNGALVPIGHASLTVSGNTYSIPADAFGLSAPPCALDVPTTFTVRVQVAGVLPSPVVESPAFTFQSYAAPAYNLTAQ